jgi:hypothetical protein
MYYVGLDPGQKQDHSAIAIVEAAWRGDGPMVRHVERVPLGTKYTWTLPKTMEAPNSATSMKTILNGCASRTEPAGINRHPRT